MPYLPTRISVFDNMPIAAWISKVNYVGRLGATPPRPLSPLRKLAATLVRFGLFVVVTGTSPAALADWSGVYLSQFSSGDPQSAAGSTDPVYLVVVDKGGTSIATVNAKYSHPSAGWTSLVWTHAIVSTASMTGGTETTVTDSFGVCDNVVRLSVQNRNIIMQSLSTRVKPGVANPLGLNCADVYPVPLTRTFIPVF